MCRIVKHRKRRWYLCTTRGTESRLRHRFCSVEMMPAIVAVMLVVNALQGQVIVDVKDRKRMRAGKSMFYPGL